MYSIKNVFTQEPAQVKSAFLAILAALVITGTVNLSGEATAAIGIAVEVLLNLFYVRPLTASKSALSELDVPTPSPSKPPAPRRKRLASR